MVISSRKMLSALMKKGFVKKNRNHKFLKYVTIDGESTSISTFVSHGSSGKTIGKSLISGMAWQCQLNQRQFRQLIDCSMTREAYEEILKDKGLLPLKEDTSDDLTHHRGLPEGFERSLPQVQANPTA